MSWSGEILGGLVHAEFERGPTRGGSAQLTGSSPSMDMTDGSGVLEVGGPGGAGGAFVGKVIGAEGPMGWTIRCVLSAVPPLSGYGAPSSDMPTSDAYWAETSAGMTGGARCGPVTEAYPSGILQSESPFVTEGGGRGVPSSADSVPSCCCRQVSETPAEWGWMVGLGLECGWAWGGEGGGYSGTWSGGWSERDDSA